MVQKVVQKAGENFQQQYQQQSKSAPNQDDIIRDTAKQTKPRETKIVGEYVDFEEIE
jgi:hypothetical protein